MTSPRLVLFDCDGTLADSGSFNLRVARAAFASVGAVSLVETYRQEFLGFSFRDFLALVSPHLTEEQRQTVHDRFWAGLREGRASGAVVEPLFPGIRDALVTLNAELFLLGAVTNKSRLGLVSVLDSNQVADCFVTLHHADNSPSKPAPDMILNALRATGVDRERCVLVGDTVNDTQLARNAGVRMVGARWNPLHHLTDADCMVDRVADLVPVLRELLP